MTDTVPADNLPAKKIKEFKWTPKKIHVAKALGEAQKTKTDIAKDFCMRIETIWRWEQFPEFLMKVDEFTLAAEQGTMAGLLRECYKGARIKAKAIKDDRSSHLDYVKEIGDLKGHKKTKIDISAKLETRNINIDIEIKKYIKALEQVPDATIES